MAAMIVLVFLLLLRASVSATPETGQWSVTIPLDKKYNLLAFPKHMYKDSTVSVSVVVHCKDSEEVDIEWMLRVSPCAMEFLGAEEQISNISQSGNGDRAMNAFNYPVWYEDPPYDEYEYLSNRTGYSKCGDGQAFPLGDHTFQHPLKNATLHPKRAKGKGTAANNEGSLDAEPQPPAAEGDASKAGNIQPAASDGGNLAASQPDASNSVADNQAAAGNEGKTAAQSDGSSKQNVASQAARKRRAADETGTKVPTSMPQVADPNKSNHPVLAKTWADGNYLLMLMFKPNKPSSNLKADVHVRMTWGDNNYLSAMDFPLLVFYGVLGLFYIVMGLVWLVMLACNWRDLLRVQFWIGGVIFLGMLEKAVFFAEYENVNKAGVSVSGAVIFAELVSCLKRTLARMLVIIVSLGFGIVKPRLGQAFHKVLFVGALFFILAAIEGCMRATSSKVDQSNQFLLAAVPLAVLDAVICWWIFSSLVQTTRTLRLRRNIVKLSLYRHFTNTLIFAVLASIAYMIWFMTQHKFQECIKDWKQLWVDEAFWHILFVILLFIIMLLWRPTANNQRYAFSPLLDAADEEEEDDAVMNDAFEGMKMRGVKAANGSPKQRDAKNKVEDDLKWVEEHIPSSVADKALPSLLDSDEELMTTKFEMSKME